MRPAPHFSYPFISLFPVFAFSHQLLRVISE
jgi:hypothetical protein